MLAPIEHRIAVELGVRPAQVIAAIALLDEGATVPFIARYRKEATGGLDDTQLRTLDERLTYLRDLEDRRAAILASIDEQGKLTPELKATIEDAETKQRLEDLYLPYKQKRRTKAQIAREAGIEPLALALLADPELTPEAEAEKFLNADAGFADVKAVLDGARQILMEKFAEDAELLQTLRDYLKEHGLLRLTVVEGKETEGAKFRDWFDFAEPIASIPSHRALALLRGRNEGMLTLRWSSIPSRTKRPSSRAEPLRAAHRRPLRHQEPGPPGRQMAGRHRALDLEGQGLHPPRTGTDGRTARARRGRGHPHLRQEPERPAARRAGRPARHHGHRPRHPHRLQGRRRRRHRQAARHRHHLPARAAPRLGRLAVHHRPPGCETPGQPGRHRQRHRQPRNRQAGAGRDQALPGTAADQDRRLRSRRLGLFRLRTRGAGNSRSRRVDSRRRVDRPPPAGPAGRAGQDRAEIHRRRPVPARRLANQAGAQPRCRRRGLRERRRRRCQYRLGAAAHPHLRPQRQGWPPTSSATATPTAPSARAMR